MTELKIGMSAIEWAREHGLHFQWSCALDNYEPCPRSWATGPAYRFIGHSGDEEWLIENVTSLKDSKSAVYIIDDGRTVRPLYVAGWHWDHDYILGHHFPTSFDADGSPRLRDDDQRPVDFTNWQLGPRRAYHLKIQQLTEE